MKRVKITLTAIIAVAMALTLSCSGDGGGDAKCGGMSYDPEIYRCESGELIGKCRGVDYYFQFEECINGEVVKKSNSSSSNIMSSSSRAVSSSSRTETPLSSSIVQGNSSSSAVLPSSSSNSVSSSSVTNAESGTFTDSRDNKTYIWVRIGDQVWMAENLNYNADDSKCYDNNTENCTTYGRLYDWETAMDVCPSGWHLSSNDDWNTLIAFIREDKGIDGNGYGAGKYLKATSGWNNSNNGVSGNGLDTYGFSALPGGDGRPDGSFFFVGVRGYWWSSTKYGSNYAYRWYMINATENTFSDEMNNQWYSVRCLQD